MNIFLIGFMGSGKSTLGKKIARKMNFNFIDLDQIIENNENLSIQNIFETKGENYFRNLESKWLEEFDGNDTVISLGGGTPCFNNNIILINHKGISIYLKMNVGLLTNRLINAKQKRPLIEKYKSSPDALENYISTLLNDREKFYNKAHLTFNAHNIDKTKLNELINAINDFCVQ